MSDSKLSAAEANALLDILVHHEAYTEIRDFRYEKAIHEYGTPFQNEKDTPSTPALHALVNRFLLQLPGLRDVSKGFWPERIEPLIAAFSASNLSESYDKGVLGQRKTCSTAISAFLEYPIRGYFGGYSKHETTIKDGKYDISTAEDITAAWEDFRQQLVYDNLLEEVFDKIGETNKLEEHPLLTQGAHRFIVVNLASIAHYTLVISPKGQALLSLLESAHKLVPYAVIRQTLKIGNVATMISGMVRIILTKASVAAVTNWLGLSKGADEGQNLMQTIVSTVLGWDNSKLKKRVSQIEHLKQGPTKEQLAALKDYSNQSQEIQEQYRLQSESQSQSIVNIILSSSDIGADLSQDNHTIALEYLNLILSIRDRNELINVLCRHHPDLLTPIARDLVTAYEPIIRAVHNAVDLSGTVWDAQVFLDDLIQFSKPKSGEKTSLPSVEDYIKLLEKHQSSCHRFLHQAVKNGPELRKWYLAFGRSILSEFRTKNSEAGVSTLMIEKLNTIFASLSPSAQSAVRTEINAQKEHLAALSESSRQRIKAILEHNDKTEFGPGIYLARWQNLLDTTVLTPSSAEGPVRHGRDIEAVEASRLDVDGKQRGDVKVEAGVQRKFGKMPDVQKTVALLSGGFWELLRNWTKEPDTG